METSLQPPPQSEFGSMTLPEVLEDLTSRFIINLPPEELGQIERIVFQIEQSHWFYEDFVRPQNPKLPSFTLKKFSEQMFKQCELLRGLDPKNAYMEFLKYKVQVPVCGAIILNHSLDKCLLVKGWKSNSAWGFPRGKINHGEQPKDCAVREVWEETGYDISQYFVGREQSIIHPPVLLPAYAHENESEDEYLEIIFQEQQVRFYIVTGVDESTPFEARTRREISEIAWFSIKDLPSSKSKADSMPEDKGSKFFLLTPFIGQLRSWIRRYKQKHGKAFSQNNNGNNNNFTPEPAFASVEEANQALQNFFFGGGPPANATSMSGSTNISTVVATATSIDANDDKRGVKQRKQSVSKTTTTSDPVVYQTQAEITSTITRNIPSSAAPHNTNNAVTTTTTSTSMAINDSSSYQQSLPRPVPIPVPILNNVSGPLAHQTHHANQTQASISPEQRDSLLSLLTTGPVAGQQPKHTTSDSTQFQQQQQLQNQQPHQQQVHQQHVSYTTTKKVAVPGTVYSENVNRTTSKGNDSKEQEREKQRAELLLGLGRMVSQGGSTGANNASVPSSQLPATTRQNQNQGQAASSSNNAINNKPTYIGGLIRPQPIKPNIDEGYVGNVPNYNQYQQYQPQYTQQPPAHLQYHPQQPPPPKLQQSQQQYYQQSPPQAQAPQAQMQPPSQPRQHVHNGHGNSQEAQLLALLRGGSK